MKDTAIFINAKDRITYLKRLLNKLEVQGYGNLHIVDTGSTWPPMVEFLRSTGYRVHHCQPKSNPKWALWNCHVLRESSWQDKRYVYTDCDVIPDCPDNWLEVLSRLMDDYPDHIKVGLGLRIDDLPDCYDRKPAVLKWEAQFWSRPIAPDLYQAPIDTTLALYREGAGCSITGLRTGGVYQARHLPWYEDSSQTREEFLHYRNHLDSSAGAYWTRGTHPLTIVK